MTAFIDEATNETVKAGYVEADNADEVKIMTQSMKATIKKAETHIDAVKTALKK